MAVRIRVDDSKFSIMIIRVRNKINKIDRWEAALEAVDKLGRIIYLHDTNGSPSGHGNRIEALKPLESLVRRTFEGNRFSTGKRMDFGLAWSEVAAVAAE